MKSKRWMKYSLRSSLLLIAVCAAFLGWINYRAEQRQSILQEIDDLGGSFRLRGHNDSWIGAAYESIYGRDSYGDVVAVDLRDTAADDELLERLGRFTEIYDLDLSSTKVTDKGVRSIAHLPLRTLWLQETKITADAGLALSKVSTLDMLAMNATDCDDTFLKNLGPLENLTDLGLRGTQVTSEGMRCIAQFPRLEDLRLYHTAVDDRGVERIAACPSIKFVGISLTSISDDCFEHLAKMPNLQEIDINACSVSKQAVAAFKKAAPNCKVDGSGR